jgi:hypothetical protein
MPCVNGVAVPRRAREADRMWTLLIILLIVWLGLSILGFVVKGLIWLAVLGIVLFLATLVIGLIRGARNRT